MTVALGGRYARIERIAGRHVTGEWYVFALLSHCHGGLWRGNPGSIVRY